MYSHEIEQLLKQKQYLISVREYLEILSTSPQIKYIKYNQFENNFYITTDDNFQWTLKLEKRNLYEKKEN